MSENAVDSLQISRAKAKLTHIKTRYKEGAAPDEIMEGLDEVEKILSESENRGQNEFSAQLSIYPLRQPSLSPTINAAIAVLSSYGLKVIPGSMSTIVIGKADDLWGALMDMFSEASSMSEVVMIVTLSNACPKPENDQT